DGEAEVRGIAADVPILEALVEERLQLVRRRGMEEARATDELGEEALVAGEGEEEVLALPGHRRRAADLAPRIDPLVGPVGPPAHVAEAAGVMPGLGGGTGAAGEAVGGDRAVALAVGRGAGGGGVAPGVFGGGVNQLGEWAVRGFVGGGEAAGGDAEVARVPP